MKICDDLRRFTTDVYAIKCDVRNREEVFNCVKEASEKFNGINILINNAGKGYFGQVEDMKYDHVVDVFETNIIARLRPRQNFMPIQLKEKG